MAKDKKLHLIIGLAITAGCFLVLGYGIDKGWDFAAQAALILVTIAAVGREILNGTGWFGVAETGFDVEDIAYTVTLPYLICAGVLLL